MNQDLLTLSAPWQLFYAFLGGFGSSLTPCVYPLIPVTLAIFGAAGDISRLKAFLLSSAYVFGMACTYTLLGIISARSGYIFGAFLGEPLVIGCIASVLFLMALFTLDIIHLPALHRLQSAASHWGGKGFGGAFVMGTASGLVAAPCIGPVLVIILGVAAASQDVVWAGALLFSYSLGLGLIFIVLGTFSGLIQRLPRSGNWLIAVKFLIAVALLLVAFILLKPLLPSDVVKLPMHWAFALALALFVLLYLSTRTAWPITMSVKLLSAIFLAYACFLATLVPVAHSNTGLTWHKSFDDGLLDAKAKNKYLMVDLYADWCAACKELDAITFSDAGVQAKLSELVLSRVDFTTDSVVTEQISEKYNVYGLPCILFLDPNGKELPNTRLTGFIGPSEFLEHLGKIPR